MKQTVIKRDLVGHTLVEYIKYSWQKAFFSSYISQNSLQYRGIDLGLAIALYRGVISFSPCMLYFI